MDRVVADYWKEARFPGISSQGLVFHKLEMILPVLPVRPCFLLLAWACSFVPSFPEVPCTFSSLGPNLEPTAKGEA